MQIGIDARLPTYQMGGISRYVIQLVRALATLNSGDHYVVFESRKETQSRFAPSPNLQRERLWTPCHHRLERWLLSAELLPRRLDLFHSPDFIPPWRGARRHVITIHDLNFIHFPQFLTRESQRYYAGQIAWAVGHADHVIADSEHTRLDLINLLQVAPDKVTTIYLAANPLFATVTAKADAGAVQATLQKHRLQPDFILFVGTVEPRKNLPILLQAFHRMREQDQAPAHLVIAGKKGWLYDEVFERITSLGLQEHVRHIENVTDIELAHLYLAAGLLALPSHYEGFGLPALEAMHCRCPVVASDRASLPEVVGDAGVLLPPTDVEAWAQAMAAILGDGDRRQQMIARGLKQAARFSWTRTAAETQKVYEQVA